MHSHQLLAALAFALHIVAASTPAPSSSHVRRTGLLHDIHSTFSNIMFGRRSQSRTSKQGLASSSSSLGKRSSSALNARHQCVLSPANSNPLAAGGTNGGSSGKPTTTATSKHGSPTTTATGATSTSSWIKQMDASGSDFFNQWTFWSTADPTNGNVQYTTSSQAAAANLTSITSNGDAIMRVDTTPVVNGNRMSVRIQSNAVFNGGLWVMDAVHMPVGCGVWPAWWTVGEDWPNNGEIDIIEGVNENTYNQASLHTGDGCTISSNFGGTGVLVAETDCSGNLPGNEGCGIRSTDPNSYGAGFNSNGGGVYAMLWDSDGISVYFFDRPSIPNDITSESPNPHSWGQPTARWPATTCAPSTFIHNHSAIFDTTLCGDWAGGAWSTGPNGGGQSCAAQTGVATCAEWVANNGGQFSEAYWQVKSVKVYQTR